MALYFIVAVVAYLFGSIPFGFLLVLLVRKQDIRAQGSGNIGATNVMRSGARGLGVLTFLLDGGKGYAAVIVAEWLARNEQLPIQIGIAILAALMVVLGHMFPVWLRFHGGKGVATAFGAFIALCWPAALSAFGIWAVLLLLSRYVSLASIVAAFALPFLTLWLSRQRYNMISVVAIFATCWLVIVKHKQNIVRLMQGNENRIGSRK
jgi:acyl phosphate:glycerol-3-phosphate acyltransferase